MKRNKKTFNNDKLEKYKKTKAFTLIELLAIIVILAIIAVITVPIILNIIENSKRGAVQDSAYGYVEAVEKNYVSNLLDDSSSKLNGTYIVSDGNFNGGEINLSGSKPTNGYLIYEDNKLSVGCLEFDGYKSIYTNGKFNSSVTGECEITTLYYSFDSNASMGTNGMLTDKVSQEDIPSEWTYWIKETTLNGVSSYNLELTSYGEMYDTESECTANISEYGATYNNETCEYVTSGYTIYDSSRYFRFYETENECLAYVDENGYDEYNCVSFSNKYFIKGEYPFELLFETESDCINNDMNTSDYRTTCTEVNYRKTNELCGVYAPEGEESRNFCITASNESVQNAFPNMNFSSENQFEEFPLSSSNIIQILYNQSKIQIVIVGSEDPVGFCMLLTNGTAYCGNSM